MNIYRHEFWTKCPNNGQLIGYKFELQTSERFMVERIVEDCKRFKEGFHEDIADQLLKMYGGHQVLKAFHHGVEIETFRSNARLEQRVILGPRVFEKGVQLIELIRYLSA